MTRGSTIGFGLLLSCAIAGGAVSGLLLLQPKSAPPETIGVSRNKADAVAKPDVLTASLPLKSNRLEGEFVITPASSVLPDFEDEAEVGDALVPAHPAPLPRQKPFGQLKLAMAADPAMLFSRDEPGPGFALPMPKGTGNWPRKSVVAAQARCEALLRGLDVDFAPRAPVGTAKGCGIAYPLSVSAIAGVRLTPPATLNCEMIAAVHEWITKVVQPAAKREFNTRLVGLQNASSYACRRRNNSSRGKLSEHALGNALDISEFRFSNRVEASVAGGWSGTARGVSVTNRGAFIKNSRKGACTYFNTVLGPGSDPFHKDHFHLDLMKLRPGRGKYCR